MSFMNSLKKQIMWGILGTAIATVLFGVGLSVVVNSALQQLEQQPDIVIPDSTTSDPLTQ